MPPPRHADVSRLARPWTDPERDPAPGRAGRRAYSSSKLCNVMTARELARRLSDTRPDVAIAAFDPGFTPGTDLVRAYPGIAPFVFRRVLPFLMPGNVRTPATSGGHLARLAIAPEFESMRGGYFAVRRRQLVEAEPSELARDAEACGRLWEDSLSLLRELGYRVPAELSGSGGIPVPGQPGIRPPERVGSRRAEESIPPVLEEKRAGQRGSTPA